MKKRQLKKDDLKAKLSRAISQSKLKADKGVYRIATYYRTMSRGPRFKIIDNKYRHMRFYVPMKSKFRTRFLKIFEYYAHGILTKRTLDLGFHVYFNPNELLLYFKGEYCEFYNDQREEILTVKLTDIYCPSVISSEFVRSPMDKFFTRKSDSNAALDVRRRRSIQAYLPKNSYDKLEKISKLLNQRLEEFVENQENQDNYVFGTYLPYISYFTRSNSYLNRFSQKPISEVILYRWYRHMTPIDHVYKNL